MRTHAIFGPEACVEGDRVTAVWWTQSVRNGPLFLESRESPDAGRTWSEARTVAGPYAAVGHVALVTVPGGVQAVWAACADGRSSTLGMGFSSGGAWRVYEPEPRPVLGWRPPLQNWPVVLGVLWLGSAGQNRVRMLLSRPAAGGEHNTLALSEFEAGSPRLGTPRPVALCGGLPLHARAVSWREELHVFVRVRDPALESDSLELFRVGPGPHPRPVRATRFTSATESVESFDVERFGDRVVLAYQPGDRMATRLLEHPEGPLAAAVRVNPRAQGTVLFKELYPALVPSGTDLWLTWGSGHPWQRNCAFNLARSPDGSHWERVAEVPLEAESPAAQRTLLCPSGLVLVTRVRTSQALAMRFEVPKSAAKPR